VALRAFALAGLLCLLAPSALAPAALEAQVLTIAETLGKGKSGLLLSDNVIVPGDGIPNLNIAYAEWAKGLTDRFDLYLSAGETTTERTTQAWVGGGGNLRLIRIRKVSLSFFSVVSVPLNKREQACHVLFNPAIVVSAPLGSKLAVYSGLNGLIPIGHREGAVFTPPSAKTNVPVGGTYAIGPWGLWLEGDFGNLRAAGLGLTRVF
jgi:hypothetical protein